MEEKAYTERRACELVGIARSALWAYRYKRRVAADEADLRARIRTLANERDAYGYRMITNLLHREGWQINVKRVHRLWGVRLFDAHGDTALIRRGLRVRYEPPSRLLLWDAGIVAE